MARLPLIINEQRLKTLEGLRENFNLTELLERFRGGQLRAWLNCWDFDSELEQVEALSPDLPEQELLEALCRIFGVEGEAKEQALTTFREEQEKREEEAKRRKEQQEAEERAKTSIAKPLTLDEIEFEWQEAEGPKIDLLTSGTDRFVAIQKDQDGLFFYSYDALHWEKAFKWKENYIDHFYCCNSCFICHYAYRNEFHYSSDSIHWKSARIDERIKTIKKIIWANGLYIALCNLEEEYHYTEKVLFIDTDQTSSWDRPVIYTAPDLSGPWHKEKISKYYLGDSLTDVTFFKGNLIFTGHKDLGWSLYKASKKEQFFYRGSCVNELETKCLDKAITTSFPSKLWLGAGRCFRCASECFESLSYDTRRFDLAYLTDDGVRWKKLKYGIIDFIDARHFAIARLMLPDSSSLSYGHALGHKGQDIGFHVSLDGINWRKLNAPLQKGKIAYLDGKLLIADGNKIAVGTLKIAHKDNTSSCSTQSGNTSTEDRDLHYNVELNAEEAKTGTIKEVTVTRSETCSLCSGSGRESGSGERNCTNCNGYGLVQGSKTLKVRVPVDVKSGAKLRVQGQGNAGRGEAQPGDLYVHITVRKEPSVSPSQTNSVDHTTPLKEIADAMNPLKNPSVLISPTDSIAKLVATRLKSGMISEEGKNK